MQSNREFTFTGLAALFPVVGAFASPPSALPSSAEMPDWPVALPGSQGISNSGLEKVLESGETVRGLRSLVVVRNGTLIAERYYGGASPSDLWAINSITKSVTSMCGDLERGRPLSTTRQTASFQTLTIA